MNTGAILGFTNSLLEIMDKQKPTHLAVAFDTAKPTFRHEVYKEYKAQREAQPEDISIAIPIIKDLLDAFNLCRIELDGFEADDLIGTISKQAASAGFEVYMMTPDKDYAQLVTEKVFLYKPAYAGNSYDILGVEEVKAKFEIKRVSQVIDFLGLQGDPVDNIPGVPGVGKKTAIKLLAHYDNIENIIANRDEFKGKMKEKFYDFEQQALLSKKLATINTEVPVEFEEEKFLIRQRNDKKIKAVFEKLEFRTLIKRLLEGGSKTNQTQLFSSPEPIPSQNLPNESHRENNILTTRHHYHLVSSEVDQIELARFLSIQDEFCFDTETTGTDAFNADLIGLAFSYKKGIAYYIPVLLDKERAKKTVAIFKEVFENPNIIKIAQNMKYDMLMLKKYGVEVKGKLFDTMLAHYLLEPNVRHNMGVLAENFLNYSPLPITDLIGKKGKNQGSMSDVPVEKVAEYAGEDADITLQLKEALNPLLGEGKLKKLYDEVELPLIEVLCDMEFNGVRVSEEVLKLLSEELTIESQKAEYSVYEMAGEKFNLASPKQLGEVLFDKMKLGENPKKTKTGQYATGEEILSSLANKHEIAAKILEFREYQKLKSTYVDALPNMISLKDGRIHTSYNQAVAVTGRLSSVNPNLQNIPIRTAKGKEIRKAFIPRSEDYLLLSADYSQIELRIMASFAQDESMIAAFKEGRDIHASTASKIFKVPLEKVSSEMRRKAKTANFGIIYGISAFGLSQRLGIPRKEAEKIIDSYFNEFPGVKRYMDNSMNKAKENMYVETILGRRRYLPDINSRNATVRGYAERNAINAPIQGSAADMIKKSMIQIHQWMRQEKLQSKMILQVHDELVFDVYQPELGIMKDNISPLMRNALLLDVPIEVGIGEGHNWLEAH